MSIRFIDLTSQYQRLKPDLDARIQRVLDHGQYVMGPEVRELEAALEQRTGASHCITCGSGTDALLMALMALGIGPGDEVITTPFSFAAAVEVILRVGATPVFVDVEQDTCNLDVSLVEAALSPRTRALMPVSLYGQPVDMDDLAMIAAHHGLAVIEDAAQSMGATYKDGHSGNLSLIGCTSFYPSKPLGCYGDGGALFTSDEALARKLRSIRDHGQASRYEHALLGLNSRMDTLQCAVVLAKLGIFEEELAARESVAQHYLDLLQDLPGVQVPVIRPDRTSAWAQFTIQSGNRAHLMAGLTSAGIPTAVHYPTGLHHQEAFSKHCRTPGKLQTTDAVASRVFSLPMHPGLDFTSQQTICETIAALGRR